MSYLYFGDRYFIATFPRFPPVFLIVSSLASGQELHCNNFLGCRRRRIASAMPNPIRQPVSARASAVRVSLLRNPVADSQTLESSARTFRIFRDTYFQPCSSGRAWAAPKAPAASFAKPCDQRQSDSVVARGSWSGQFGKSLPIVLEN